MTLSGTILHYLTLLLFGTILHNLTLSDTIRYYLVPSGKISPNLAIFSTIWKNMTHFGTILHNLSLSYTIWYYLVPSGNISPNLTIFDTIWSIMALSGTIWQYLILHGSASLEKVASGASGTYGHFVRNSIILMTCRVKYPILLTDIGERRVEYGKLMIFEEGRYWMEDWEFKIEELKILSCHINIW